MYQYAVQYAETVNLWESNLALVDVMMLTIDRGMVALATARLKEIIFVRGHLQSASLFVGIKNWIVWQVKVAMMEEI